MPLYEVTAEAEGDALIVIEAADEAEAERIATSERLVGITIEGGRASWSVTNVREAE